MKIISRYLLKTLFSYFLTVALIWVIIFAFFDLLSDIGNIDDKYSLTNALYVVSLRTPYIVYENIIIIILIATVLALGNLSNNSELIIMRSSGKSIVNIVLNSTFFALIFMLIVAIFSEFYAADMKLYADKYKTNILVKTDKSKQNLWLKEGEYIINIKNNYASESFVDLLIFKIKNNQLLQTIQAKRGLIKDDKLFLSEVKQKLFNQKQIITKNYDDYQIDINFNSQTIDNFSIKIEDLSIMEIYKHIQFLKTNNIKDNNFIVVFYQRLIKIVILAITIIFASIFIFSSLRTASMGKKLFLAIVISLFFELALRISGSFVVKFDYNYTVVVIVPVVILLFIVLGLLVKKSNE
jgi:lipopolysaccharide export system permease protein